MLGQPVAGNGHAHAVGHSLPERTGSGFHPGGVSVLRMTRTTAAQLAEAADFFQGHSQLVVFLTAFSPAAHPGQMEHCVQEHRRVSTGKHKAVAIWPSGGRRIVTQHLVKQHVGHRRKGHGRAGMPAAGRLHSIHGKRSDRIDGQLFQLLYVLGNCHGCVLSPSWR